MYWFISNTASKTRIARNCTNQVGSRLTSAVDAVVTNLKSRARMISTSAVGTMSPNRGREIGGSRQGRARALRKLTLGTGKSAGRNSSGRITIFHRGGGAKRLLRRIDLKRSTSSMGIVESIEYDPNRSSQIALVRWINGGCEKKMNTTEEFVPPRKIPEPTTNAVIGLFSFSFLPRKVDQRKVACFSPGLKAAYAVVGLPTSSKNAFASKGAGSTKTLVKDVFSSAFSSPKAKRETASLASASSFGFPRIAVAGAKPAFFAPQMRQKVRGDSTFSLCDVQKWRTNSIPGTHGIKDKAELSWQSFRGQDTLGLGLVGAAGHNKLKPKTDQGSLRAKPVGERAKKDGAGKVDRAPVTYIIASHHLEAGKMVINCDWSKPSSSSFLRSA